MSERIPEHRYTAALANEIEARWQERWEAEDTFSSANPAGPWAEPDDPRLERGHRFIMDMFPYPSGTGLHVGHPLGFIATDVHARFARTTGMNVLHTMGFDAFGLPAEQYAVQTGQHPRVTTEANITAIAAQLRRLSPQLRVRDGTRYFASVNVGSSNGVSATFNASIEWFSMAADETLTSIGSSLIGTYTGSGTYPLDENVVAPANARRARIMVIKLASAAASALTIFAPIFYKSTSNKMLDDGAVTDGKFDPTPPGVVTTLAVAHGSLEYDDDKKVQGQGPQQGQHAGRDLGGQLLPHRQIAGRDVELLRATGSPSEMLAPAPSCGAKSRRSATSTSP